MNEEKMGVASEYITDGNSESTFLKGVDFDGNGLEVEVVSMEKFTPDDPKYGVTNTYGPGGVVTKENWFIKKKLLDEGQTWRYTFKVDGVQKVFDNKSATFYFAFTRVNPEPTEVLSIKRNKISDTKVDWTINKIAE